MNVATLVSTLQTQQAAVLRGEQPVYLLLAAASLLIALVFMRQALAPVGALVRAVAAAAVVALAVSIALILLAAAALSGR